MKKFFHLTPRWQKKLQKFFSTVAIFSLFLQIGSGIFYYQPILAEEEIASEEITSTPASPVETTSTLETAPPSEPTPEIPPQVTPTPLSTEEITPTPTTDISQTNQENSTQSQKSGLSLDLEKSTEVPVSGQITSAPTQVEKVCLAEDQEIKDTTNDNWDINLEEGWAQTKEPVKLGVKYLFPQENKVSVTFKCLPKDESLRTSLKIQKIKISDLNLPEDVNPYGEYAYDITTGMQDGTFEYDVTLPKPENKAAEVFFMEEPNGELQTVSEEKLNQEGDKVKIESLDHFTIFIATYSDNTFKVDKYQYVRGETVYIKAEDLKKDKYYRIKVFDNSSEKIVVSCRSRDVNNELKGEYTLLSSDPLGIWQARLYEYDESDCSGREYKKSEAEFEVIATANNNWNEPLCKYDPKGDESPAESDLYGLIPDLSAAFYKEEGGKTWFRERVVGNPLDSKNKFKEKSWVVLFQDPSSEYYQYLLTVSGKGPGDDTVELWKNTNQTEKVDWSPIFRDKPENKILEKKVKSGYARAYPDGQGNWFVEWGVETSELTNLGINILTWNLYFATSEDSNNFNKDHLDCYETPVTPTPTMTPTPTTTSTPTPTPTATPTPGPVCGNGHKDPGEECDGTDGVTQGQNFCTATCHLVPIYDGQHSCPAGTVRSQNPIITKQISATDPDGELVEIGIDSKVLLEVTGTFRPTSSAGWYADAGYTTGDNWSSLDPRYGIHGTGDDYAAHALLSDFGTGTVGVVDWGDYNRDHVYTKYYEVSNSNQTRFVIGDRYGDWFNTRWQDQAGMDDNSGYLTLNVYECQEYGSISGYKWEDLDGDGSWDSGEPTVNGDAIPVTIYIDVDKDGMQDVGDPHTDIDENGYYSFPNLTAGDYIVCERDDLLAGWKRTFPQDSNCQMITIGAGEDKTGVNFGNFQLGYIQGRKYKDVNQNGSRESGEPWLAGWTINLYDANWSLLNSTTTTNNTGIYRFENLDLGTYYTCEVLTSGWAQTGPVLGSNRVTNQSPNKANEGAVCWKSVINQSGQSRTGRQFGNIQYGSISGYKWEDVDGDGIWDDDESGLNNWTIFLDENENGILDDEESSLITADSGYYKFENLLAGKYFVCEVEQDGWTRTYPSESNCQEVTVGAGQNILDINFGNFQNGQITVCKYDDYNGNGIKDPGEPGLANISVELQTKAGEVWGEDVIAATTGTDGCYTFTNLGPGIYRTRENLTDSDLAGYSPTDNFTTDGDYRVSGEITMVSNGNFSIDYFNDLNPIKLELTKTSDKIGKTASPGDRVSFELTVKNTASSSAYGVTVNDVLPIDFSYVSGSGKVEGVAQEPVISGSQLTWNLGTIPAGGTKTITYQADIKSGAKNGSYPNIAVSFGTNRTGDPDNSISYSNFAVIYTTVGTGNSYSASVGGGLVLGAATTSGQVLGAATGSPTFTLIVAILMILGGLLILKKGKKIHA